MDIKNANAKDLKEKQSYAWLVFNNIGVTAFKNLKLMHKYKY